jgi:hypothetical protein
MHRVDEALEEVLVSLPVRVNTDAVHVVVRGVDRVARAQIRIDLRQQREIAFRRLVREVVAEEPRLVRVVRDDGVEQRDSFAVIVDAVESIVPCEAPDAVGRRVSDAAQVVGEAPRVAPGGHRHVEAQVRHLRDARGRGGVVRRAHPAEQGKEWERSGGRAPRAGRGLRAWRA